MYNGANESMYSPARNLLIQRQTPHRGNFISRHCFNPLFLSYTYFRLRDESVVVRYNTLMVITHLVLNDMIKVKGTMRCSGCFVFPVLLV